MKKEIVFLPYKASMWDSLESVWRKASEDPSVSALVIPIPYYDKNADGSFGERHYEIDDYPPEVPVVRYEDYDFAARHPSKIYIHNPYDGGNLTTSVEPFFYSSNLKQYTDDLVYIPYFVLNEPDPSNEAALEGLETFVTVSAVIHAHHVIVQSEAMRQCYIEIMTRATREDLRPYWENKILGTGSPKLERVANLRAEDFELPEEWERLIIRPDGSRRKVIFYNTGVSALLNTGVKMLIKILDNFCVFYENREEITLLWRPHPLMEATIAAQKPELLPEYRNIVADYLEAGWGIYDDTPELDRAIAISDAYYGDMSSVVWLYKQTGKPIMIQNMDILSDLDE